MPITVKLDFSQAHLQQVDKIAKAQYRTRTKMIQKVVEDFICAKESADRYTKALEDSDDALIDGDNSLSFSDTINAAVARHDAQRVK